VSTIIGIDLGTTYSVAAHLTPDGPQITPNAPETIASLRSPDRTSFEYQRILDDWPLRTVCLAHRLIWT
jgi:molecular chaperone DnaK (HSP70)